MKATATQYIPPPTPEPFRPVTLTLTLESQDEVNAIHNLFNSTHILDALHQSMGIERWTATSARTCVGH